jgi:hypothetical protein
VLPRGKRSSCSDRNELIALESDKPRVSEYNNLGGGWRETNASSIALNSHRPLPDFTRGGLSHR